MDFALAWAVRNAAAVVSPTSGSGCPFVITGLLGPCVGWCGCLKAAFDKTAFERRRCKLLSWEGPPEPLARPSMAFMTSFTNKDSEILAA